MPGQPDDLAARKQESFALLSGSVIHRCATLMSANAILGRDNISLGRARPRRWLGSAADADDIAQTVGEKLLKFDAEPSPAYLAAMFRSAHVDAVRAETTRRHYEAQYAAEADTVDHETPERRLAGLRALEALESAMAELGPVNRDIFVRAYLDEQPRAAIAEALGLRLSTVEKRLAKARRHCIARLRPHLD